MSGYTYAVERSDAGAGRVTVALVRREARPPRRMFGARRGQALVMYHRTFRAMLELAKLEAYAAALGQVAEHASKGTLGCFVDTVAREGTVEVTLWERWFDGDRVRCESLASRPFDAEDDGALVASSEFVASLAEWAQERNDEFETRMLEASVEDADASARATDRAAAAQELAQILGAHTRRTSAPGEGPART